MCSRRGRRSETMPGAEGRSHISGLLTATARVTRCDQPCGLRSHSRTCGSAPDLEIRTPRGSGAACPGTTSGPTRPPAGPALLHEGRDPLAKGYPYCTNPRPPCSTPNPPPVAPQPRAVHHPQASHSTGQQHRPRARSFSLHLASCRHCKINRLRLRVRSLACTRRSTAAALVSWNKLSRSSRKTLPQQRCLTQAGL